MMTLLVPTDYSPNADHALRYALHLAKQGSAKVLVFHLTEILIPTSTPHHLYQELYDQHFKNKQEELAIYAKRIAHTSHAHVPIEDVVVDGFDFLNELQQVAEDHKVGLIVMGTKGASGLKKVLMGSNTVKVIEHSKIPVLAIPETAKITTLHSIAYASDLKDPKNEVDRLLKFSRMLQLSIRIFHVYPNYPEWISPSPENIEGLLSQLKKSHPKDTFTLELVQTEKENDIVEGIRLYLDRHKPDILAMFPAEKSFLSSLFQSSNTEEMAFQATVPLLVLN